MSQSHTNRLINETSPYLLQHAHNPVDWYPWGTEALEKAKAEGKPILLSIGYSACHWCHVMERESFENEEIANQMNELFICIKVDREERPDLDSIYMSATVAMNNGHGGWPMTVFLTPDQAPFFAGTYFPPHDAHGRPGFPRVLQSIARAWSTDQGEVIDQSKDLVRFLKQESEKTSVRLVGETQIAQAIQNLHRGFDTVNGGFSPAPKFPAAASISLLLRFHHNTANPTALKMADHTLTMMAKGGIYDHIGGGFARYSVDEKWLVPHFEKMLYDNALLIRSYVEGWQVTQKTSYLAVVRETLDFTIREMTGPEGGFYSALDADSEGEEGKFYVWTPAQIREVLDSKSAEIFCTAFDISTEGNFEGANIAHPVQSHDELAKQYAMSAADIHQNIADSKVRLLDARNQRIRPGTDDKVITAWNGMMIGAMALGHQITGDQRYLLAAKNAADFIHTHLTDNSELLRTWRAGKAQLRAYLEDYAYLGEGLLDLYEAGGGFQYLARAQVLAKQILEQFSDPKGGALFSTAHNHEELIVRKKEGHDGATPSENAVAANLFARLSQHFNDETSREAAISIIEAFGEDISKMPRAFSKTLHAVDTLLSVPTEIVFCGPADSELAKELRQTVFATYLPHHVIAHQETSGAHPLLEGREATAAETVFVCENFTCLQ
ncbi:MAG: thioredoxin domain-containing protein, partial [Deltaproteobacteria bacterium]|nr:thioredoxin domain-containing protein [Deltaproteobacteria bacterium]